VHYLLVPYSILAAVFLLSLTGVGGAPNRRSSGPVAVALLIFLLLTIAVAVRTPAGDSSYYLSDFRSISGEPFGQAVGQSADPLFALLSWLVGRVSLASWAFFGSIFVLFAGVFGAALLRLFRPQHAAVMVVAYSMYPFAVAYATNGLRQGLALAFLLMGLVSLRESGVVQGWIWLLMAPGWHSGAWLAVIAIAVVQLLTLVVRRPSYRLGLVLGVLVGAILLSVSGLNVYLTQDVAHEIGFEPEPRQAIYLQPAAAYGDYAYQAGFRVDFLTLSLLPIASMLVMRRRIRNEEIDGVYWWLTVYVVLNVVYHLFSFAPFADRFGAFSWILIPVVIYMQVCSTRSSRAVESFAVMATVSSVVLLATYTGPFLTEPVGW